MTTAELTGDILAVVRKLRSTYAFTLADMTVGEATGIAEGHLAQCHATPSKAVVTHVHGGFVPNSYGYAKKADHLWIESIGDHFEVRAFQGTAACRPFGRGSRVVTKTGGPKSELYAGLKRRWNLDVEPPVARPNENTFRGLSSVFD